MPLTWEGFFNFKVFMFWLFVLIFEIIFSIYLLDIDVILLHEYNFYSDFTLYNFIWVDQAHAYACVEEAPF